MVPEQERSPVKVYDAAIQTFARSRIGGWMFSSVASSA
jgi:hypothetical protein